MHKYSHSGVKPFLKGKLLVLWEIEKLFPKTTSQMSQIFTHTGEKLYKRRSVICVENIFPKPLSWRFPVHLLIPVKFNGN